MKFIFTIATMTVLPGRVFGTQRIRSLQVENHLLQIEWDMLQPHMETFSTSDTIVSAEVKPILSGFPQLVRQLRNTQLATDKGSAAARTIANLQTSANKLAAKKAPENPIKAAIGAHLAVQRHDKDTKYNGTTIPYMTPAAKTKLLDDKKVKFRRKMTAATNAVQRFIDSITTYLESAEMIELDSGRYNTIREKWVKNYETWTPDRRRIGRDHCTDKFRGLILENIEKLCDDEIRDTETAQAELDMLQNSSTLKVYNRRRLNEIETSWGALDTLCVLFGISVAIGLTILLGFFIQHTLSKSEEEEHLGPAEVPAHIV